VRLRVFLAAFFRSGCTDQLNFPRAESMAATAVACTVYAEPPALQGRLAAEHVGAMRGKRKSRRRHLDVDGCARPVHGGDASVRASRAGEEVNPLKSGKRFKVLTGVASFWTRPSSSRLSVRSSSTRWPGLSRPEGEPARRRMPSGERRRQPLDWKRQERPRRKGRTWPASFSTFK